MSLTALLLCLLSWINSASNPSASSNTNSSLQQSDSVSKAVEKFAQEGCSLTEGPIKGSTNQGGYVFEYESYSGTGATGACRLYRLRNTPGRLYTPVQWKDSEETWFDTALAACPAGSACPAIEVTKESLLKAQDGKSALSYGVNKEEFSEDPDAFKRHQSEKGSAASSKFPKFVTTISGVIADLDKRPFQISIRVVSYLKNNKAPFEIVYEFQTGPGANALSVNLAEQNQSTPVRAIWGVTSSPAFVGAAQQKDLRWLTGSNQQAEVALTSSSVTLNDQERLVISHGGTPIFVTTAPAYVPKEPR